MSQISAVNAFVVPYVEPNDHGSTRYVCLVQVIDSDGVAGWGEAVTLFREAALATGALLAGLKELLVGQAADPAVVAQAISDHGWWYADSGIACFASSAVDLALWDIAGKRAGIPLLEALGSEQEFMRVVVTCHATESDLHAMAAGMAQTVSDRDAIGIKVGFGKRGDAALGFDHERDRKFVRELRTALGPEALMMIDIGAKIRWSVDEAIARIAAFEEYDVHWTEEPLGADDPEGYRRLKDSVRSLIAYGEREWSPRGYEKILRSGTVDVIGIDPGRAGGVTGFVSALLLARESGAQANAHAFAGPITFAASLALSQSSTACRQLEQMPLTNGLYDLIEGAPEARDGKLQSTRIPGLGLDVDEREVRKAAVATFVDCAAVESCSKYGY